MQVDSVPTSDPQISLQRLRDHFIDVAQAMSQKLRNSQVDRNMAMSVPNPKPLGLLFQTWDSPGIFRDNDDLWSLRFDGSKFGVIRRMPPFCYRIGGNDFGGVKTLIKLSELHMTCIPNTSQYVNIPQYCKTETRFQYLLIWFGQSYYQAICQDDHPSKVQPTQQARCLPWQPWWLRPRQLPRAPWSLRRQPR